MNDPHRNRCADYQLVEESIEAALLARALDSSREVLLAEFQRAERLARKSGTLRQMMRVRYLQACTDDGWFGVVTAPRNAFVHLCAEYLYRSSVWEIDYLVHLWLLAQVNSKRYVSQQPQAFRQAELAVNDSLTWLAGNTGRPVQAAWAQLLLGCMGLARARLEHGDVRPWWLQLRAVVQEAQSLPTFPLDRVSQWLSRLQDVTPSDPALREWADRLSRLREKRLGATAMNMSSMHQAANSSMPMALHHQFQRHEGERRHEQRRA